MTIRAPRRRPTATPSLVQMEAVECGAASLGILLHHYGRIEPLESLRIACGVSRDGANAAAILTAARQFGMEGEGRSMDLEDLSRINHPVIIHWAFQHFMVLEGFRRTQAGLVVHVNDPATGPRIMPFEEFDSAFTGVVLDLVPSADFTKGGKRRSIRHAVAARLRGMGGALALTLFATALMVVPGVIAPLLQQMFITAAGQESGSARWAVPLAMAICALVLVLLTSVQREHLLRVEIRMALTAATQFFEDLLRKPMAFFGQRHAADLSGRVDSNFRVSASIASEVVVALASVSYVLVYGLALVALDPVLASLTIAVASLNLLLLRWILRRQKDASAAQRAGEAGLARETMHTLSTIASVKGNGTEQTALRTWAGYSAKVVGEGQKLGMGTALLNVLPTALASLNLVLVLVVGGVRIAEAGAGIGALLAFQAILTSFTQPLTQLVTQSGRLQITQTDLDRIEDVLRYPSDPTNDASDTEPTVLDGHLTLDAVDYSFSADEPWIKDLSFDVAPGTSVALVGASGSGKSTVGKLASGLLAPHNGHVLINGAPRESHLQASLSSAVALVDQNITLFEGTVRENVTLWDPSVPDQAIVRALEDAEVFDVVAQRAGGLNAIVSEGGRNFSGGQRQRLEIARALAGDPALLILDEATSACDALTEEKIMVNLRRRGCAMLIIAHRLSTIRNADLILVFDNGCVVESGTHDDLVRTGTLYRHLLSQEAKAAEEAA
ncbi:MAG: ATP-binding cassette domain-containing protein [Propionibacteriaceae bacterium]|nr:ATP-binding cassette domain-containing protein [Propionibacteriaceae bacterium]